MNNINFELYTEEHVKYAQKEMEKLYKRHLSSFEGQALTLQRKDSLDYALLSCLIDLKKLWTSFGFIKSFSIHIKDKTLEYFPTCDDEIFSNGEYKERIISNFLKEL